MISSSEQTTAHKQLLGYFHDPEVGTFVGHDVMAEYCGTCIDLAKIVAPRVVSTVAELDALGGNSVLYSQAAWAVLRKQSHGTDWITDHACRQGEPRMMVTITVESSEHGYVEVRKSEVDRRAYGGTTVTALRALIEATTEQALLAYPTAPTEG